MEVKNYLLRSTTAISFTELRTVNYHSQLKRVSCSSGGCTIHNVTHNGWAADVEVPGCALVAGGSALREGGWVPQGGSVPGKGGWAPGEGSVPAMAPL